MALVFPLPAVMENVDPLVKYIQNINNVVTGFSNNLAIPLRRDDNCLVPLTTVVDLRFGCHVQPADKLNVSPHGVAPVDYREMLDFAQRLSDSLEQHCNLLLLAEACACGRAISELKKMATPLRKSCIESEVNFYRLECLRGLRTNNTVEQVHIIDGYDVTQCLIGMLGALHCGSLVVTCPTSSPLCLPLHLLFSLIFEHGKPPQGLSLNLFFVTETRLLAEMSDASFDEVHLERIQPAGDQDIVISTTQARSCFLVFEDGDMDAAAYNCLSSIAYGSGTLPSTPHVTLVQESIIDAFLSKLTTASLQFSGEDVLDKNSSLGLLRKDELSALDHALKQLITVDGAEVLNYSSSTPGDQLRMPLIITLAQTSTTFMQQLPSGPYTCVLPFRTTKEAVTIANSIGLRRLVAYVWSESLAHSMECAELLRYSHVAINSGCTEAEYLVPITTRCAILRNWQEGGKWEGSMNTSFIAQLQSKMAEAGKSQQTWAKKSLSHRQSTVFKLFNALKQTASLHNFAELGRTLGDLMDQQAVHQCAPSIDRSGPAKQLLQSRKCKLFEPRGVVLFVLDGQQKQANAVSLALLTALLLGNSVVLLTNGDCGINLKLFDSVGVDKNTVQILPNVSVADLHSVTSVRQLDLLWLFGGGELAIDILRHAAAPLVLIRKSIDEYELNELLSDLRPWLIREKIVNFSIGDIFAN